jgi:hypothetical protein
VFRQATFKGSKADFLCNEIDKHNFNTFYSYFILVHTPMYDRHCFYFRSKLQKIQTNYSQIYINIVIHLY